jgi:hypothetical protein
MSDLYVEVLDSGREHEDQSSQGGFAQHHGGIPGLAAAGGPRDGIDASILVDPLRWTKWRLEARRFGAYAPRYEGRSFVIGPTALNLVCGALLLALAMTIMLLLKHTAN